MREAVVILPKRVCYHTDCSNSISPTLPVRHNLTSQALLKHFNNHNKADCFKLVKIMASE